jgi:hypothetical protein
MIVICIILPFGLTFKALYALYYFEGVVRMLGHSFPTSPAIMLR